jgi:hypothetical protein
VPGRSTSTTSCSSTHVDDEEDTLVLTSTSFSVELVSDDERRLHRQRESALREGAERGQHDLRQLLEFRSKRNAVEPRPERDVEQNGGRGGRELGPPPIGFTPSSDGGLRLKRREPTFSGGHVIVGELRDVWFRSN